jgi:hypothetical protein
MGAKGRASVSPGFSGAHLFVLMNKISLGAAQYFIVQNIYRGWSLFGSVLFGALISIGYPVRADDAGMNAAVRGLLPRRRSASLNGFVRLSIVASNAPK